MAVETIFQANLNADKIYIDMTYLPDPIMYRVFITIKNQSLSTLYFKIIVNIPNWSLDTPSDGKLGSVGAGGTGTPTIVIARAKPEAETVDDGNITIEAYTDSNYTSKISEDTLNVTIYIEDLENWTYVQKFDFDDGTDQGWSGGEVRDEISVEPAGYSYRTGAFRVDGKATSTGNRSISRSITLPNTNKIRLSQFVALRYTGDRSGDYGQLVGVSVKVNDAEVFKLSGVALSKSGATTGYSTRWIKLTADLSDYRDQTVTITITYTLKAYASVQGYSVWLYAIVDRIVIAGKD